MDVFVADLDEDAAAVGEEVAGDGEAVAEVGEVAVDAVAPGVAEGFDLFGFAGDVFGFAVFDIAAGGGPLEVGIELDAVRRVKIDALYAAAQSFAFGDAGHDVEAVAEDHAVGPVLFVAVELGALGAFGEAVEVGEEVGLGVGGSGAPGGAAFEVVDEGLGVDFFLDVDRRGVHEEFGAVLLVFAAPDELGVQVGIAGVAEFLGGEVGGVHDGLVFGGGDVGSLGLGVGEGGDALGGSALCHGCVGSVPDGRGVGEWVYSFMTIGKTIGLIGR